MITRKEFNKLHPITKTYKAHHQATEFHNLQGEAKTGPGTREHYNRLHPANGNYSACQQAKDYHREYPLLAPGEVRLPVISEKTNLSRDDAVAELEELDNVERPRFGFQSWLETKIENRKVQLSQMIANSFREDSN